jgi:phenylpropionate dioxygenase-like ring-hydroxylating dioxygenase large terminal subunit
MTFLRNTWYLAAWDNEVTRTLFARDIVGESVLMYRKQDGSPVAMANRCPHRFAPLSMGKLKGDVVECGYHGLQFDFTGQCVLNPHPGGSGPIPRGAKVAQYPLIERYGALWIWMGEKTPDESLLPDFNWLDEPPMRAGEIGRRRRDTREIRDMCVVNAHYELIVDNVLDLTHLPYLHEGGLGNHPKYLYNEKVENIQQGNTFWCKRSSQKVEASPDFERFNPKLAEFPCDKANAVRWNAPGHVVIVPTYWKSGTDKEHLTCLYISTMLTPASEGKTWQFWSLARNFALDSDEVDLAMRNAAAVGLEKEDVDVIETQWRYMGTADIFSLGLASLPGDITPNRVRRALAKMIAEEQSQTKEYRDPAPISEHQNVRLTA